MDKRIGLIIKAKGQHIKYCVLTKLCNELQRSTTIYNDLQRATTTCNELQRATRTYNELQRVKNRGDYE